jgi:hypothetical protein
MGWKSVQDHYGITRRQVHVRDGEMRIGDEVVIGTDGTVVVRRDWNPPNEITAAVERMRADPDTLRALMARPDDFGPSVPIWTYRGDRLVEDLCETPEWPGLTHSGEVIYENTHSTDREEAFAFALSAANAGVEAAHEHVVEAETRLAQARRRLSDQMERLNSLTRWHGQPPANED